MRHHPLSSWQAPIPPIRTWGNVAAHSAAALHPARSPQAADADAGRVACEWDGPPLQVRSAKLARLETALLTADVPLSPRKLVQYATLVDAAEARSLIEELNRCYDDGGSAFRIEEVATGYRLLTRPEFAPWLSRLHHREAEVKLSPPALETLTIIAYRQPMTRADIEAVRGVQSSEIIKQLMERGLVRIAGEDDSLGRPYLYETTRKFLELYGLQTLNDLPMADQLRRSGRGGNGPKEAAPKAEDGSQAA